MHFWNFDLGNRANSDAVTYGLYEIGLLKQGEFGLSLVSMSHSNVVAPTAGPCYQPSRYKDEHVEHSFLFILHHDLLLGSPFGSSEHQLYPPGPNGRDRRKFPRSCMIALTKFHY